MSTSKKKGARKSMPGSVFQRGNKWAYKFYGQPDMLTGEKPEIRKSGFESSDEAWEAMLEARAALSSNIYVRPSRQTVAAFFESWFPYVRTTTEATTAVNYENLARLYVLPKLGKRPLQDITAPVIAALYEHLLTEARAGKRNSNWEMYLRWKSAQQRGEEISARALSEIGDVTPAGARKAMRRYEVGRVPAEPEGGYAPKTVLSVHIMLGSAMSAAKNVWKCIGANPMEVVKAPSVTRRPHKTWTPEQMARFLEVARADRLYGLWVLVASTGMRRSELCGLTRGGLDLTVPGAETVRMNVTSVVAGGKVTTGGGKSRTSRRPVSLDRYTAAVLREHLDRLDAERDSFGTSYHNAGLVFCWEDGRRIYPDTITEKFNALVDRAGLPVITLHGVRHSYATISLRSGVHPKVVSTRIGHSSVAFTLDVYSEDVPGLDREASENIGSLFLPTPSSNEPPTDRSPDVPGAPSTAFEARRDAILELARVAPDHYQEILQSMERRGDDHAAGAV
ncbi:tyrosine-type recombinase/integrase [Saccharopolyspora shandongensis]|uniref:tyrosine-type recombinase/integrase n=1 Tax=Saccharopolyspora shandongensis TaxID=418495 RepID=UPI0034370580